MNDIVSINLFYFGCLNGAYGHTDVGHYWYRAQPHKAGYIPPAKPMSVSNWDVKQVLGKFIADQIDDTYTPPEPKAGLWAIHWVHGCTIIAMHDYSGDGRGASNSAFVADGLFDFATMINAALGLYGGLFERWSKADYSLGLVWPRGVHKGSSPIDKATLAGYCCTWR